MIKWFQKNRLLALGLLIGALAGFLYWKYVGCISGTCSITSDPLNSTLYGALLGGLFFSFFQPQKQSKS